ncbi:MAG TPA: segregation/condensation protein A, partial [Betaproteobacteria bacterium]|nr:segregation/condensation protein A [Betaproteobacteria bacterium]
MDPTDLLASTTEQTRIGTYRGEPIIDVPANLYIPPEALQVMLDSFEGP